MTTYHKVLASLGVDDAVMQCASGVIPLPLEGIELPPYWYGFPPALIPLWSRPAGPGYIGIWKHWFINNEPTYVNVLVDADRLAIEIARTAKQFLYFTIIAAIVEQDGITPEIEQFSQRVGVDNLAEIDALTLTSGDNPAGFYQLSPFKEKLPHGCLRKSDVYDGNFPFVNAVGALSGVLTSSEFEFDSAAWRGEAIVGGRLFLKECETLQDGFLRLLTEGNFGQAWLVLNSRGWLISDARVAIAQLADRVRDSQFDILTSAWLSVADPRAGSY